MVESPYQLACGVYKQTRTYDIQKVGTHAHWTNRIRPHWRSLQFLPLPPFCLLVFHLPVPIVAILEVCRRIASDP